MRTKRILLLAAAALYLPFAGAAFKCVDEKGITHIGDTPPDKCATVPMFEIKANGSVIRKIEPTPSPEQAKTLAVEQERKREADKRDAEQKRKDAALLSTYSNEREFDVVLERTISPIRSRMKGAHERIAAIDARQKKIEEEMEFYKAGKSKMSKKADEAPPTLVAEQERLFFEKQSLVNGIASQEKEIVQLEERFGADKKRWVRIRGGGTVGDAPATATTAADTKPAKKPGGY
ncbi:MAG TPA: DUF4124 domain-containing protein [Usitatibacter sp.]|nr:DUF4124 domain-containing protein [Usitatibacter sp.]